MFFIEILCIETNILREKVRKEGRKLEEMIDRGPGVRFFEVTA